GWNWSFNAPEGDGYYGFMTIATDSAWNAEAKPLASHENSVFGRVAYDNGDPVEGARVGFEYGDEQTSYYEIIEYTDSNGYYEVPVISGNPHRYSEWYFDVRKMMPSGLWATVGTGFENGPDHVFGEYAGTRVGSTWAVDGMMGARIDFTISAEPKTFWNDGEWKSLQGVTGAQTIAFDHPLGKADATYVDWVSTYVSGYDLRTKSFTATLYDTTDGREILTETLGGRGQYSDSIQIDNKSILGSLLGHQLEWRVTTSDTVEQVYAGKYFYGMVQEVPSYGGTYLRHLVVGDYTPSYGVSRAEAEAGIDTAFPEIEHLPLGWQSSGPYGVMATVVDETSGLAPGSPSLHYLTLNNPTFSDEFGGGALDATKWATGSTRV
ncbi:MAG: hypothetical protein AB1744_15495, partial [Candidatus Zixiibacteriota bacterium]